MKGAGSFLAFCRSCFITFPSRSLLRYCNGANVRAVLFLRRQTHTDGFSFCFFFSLLEYTTPADAHLMAPRRLILFYFWPGNGRVELRLLELSSTILSHIGLTSNTSDKPILSLPTESSPCPKITLLSPGSQQRRMVSRVLIPALGNRQCA